MSRSWGRVAAVLAVLLGLTSCSQDAPPTPGPDTAEQALRTPGDLTATDEPKKQQAVPLSGASTTSAPDEAGPDFHEPAPADLTAAEVEELIEQQAVPVAPTHGGAFETMTNSLTVHEAPDVMILGDSMVQQGVDPQVLSDLLSEQEGELVTVFNGASSRARWGINRLLARYVVQQDKVPRVTLIGITTRAAENDLFYSTEAAKTAFSAVVEGCDRPVSDTWTQAQERACQRSRTDLVFRFRDGGGQISWARSGRPLPTSLVIDEDSRLRDDGMMVHPGIDVADVERISEKRMERGFPGFPRNDELATEQFQDTVRILQDAGSTVLTFELPYTPVHQDNLQEVGRNYDQRRQDVAASLARAGGVQHFPVQRFGEWWGNGDSRDAIHLSPQGAADFTRQLRSLPGFAAAMDAGLH